MFTRAAFTFLRELRDRNDREWFAANKERYEKVVRDPALKFIAAFAPKLAKISPHLVADPRPVGGSMFRIYRDTRFSRDKSPYKTSASLEKLRQAIVDDSPAWRALMKSKLPLEGESLKRPPRGFPADHRYLDAIKHTDYVTSVRYSDDALCDAEFPNTFARVCKTMAPMARFAAESLRLPW